MPEDAVDTEEWVLLHTDDEFCAHRHRVTDPAQCVMWNTWLLFGRRARIQLLQVGPTGHAPATALRMVCGPELGSALWTPRALASGTADLVALARLEAQLEVSPLRLGDGCSAVAFELSHSEQCRVYGYPSCISYLYDFHSPMVGGPGLWEGPCDLIALYLKILRLLAVSVQAMMRELLDDALLGLEFRMLCEADWLKLLRGPHAPKFRRLFPALSALQHRASFAWRLRAGPSHGEKGRRGPRWRRFQDALLSEARAGLFARPGATLRLGGASRAVVLAAVARPPGWPIEASAAVLRVCLARRPAGCVGRVQSRLFAASGGWRSLREAVTGTLPVWALLGAATASRRGAEGVEFSLRPRGVVEARYAWDVLGHFLYRLSYLVT